MSPGRIALTVLVLAILALGAWSIATGHDRDGAGPGTLDIVTRHG